jgi:hypothetical protein
VTGPREFIAGLGSAAAWPAVALATPRKRSLCMEPVKPQYAREQDWSSARMPDLSIEFPYFKEMEPKRYKRYIRLYRILSIVLYTLLCFLFLSIVVFFLGFFLENSGPFIASGIISFFLLCVLAIPVVWSFQQVLPEIVGSNERCKRDYEILQNNENLKLQRQIAESTSTGAGVLINMSEDKAFKAGRNIIQTINIKGDASNVNIVGGDYLVDAVKTVEQDNAALANALTTIAGALKDVKNEEAQKTFSEMNRSIVEGSNKITIKALWGHLVSLVPDLIKMTEAVATLTKFFAI